MNRNAGVVIGIIVVLLIIAGGAYVYINTMSGTATTTPSGVANSATGGTVCTQDVQQCPDGSFVSRTGPDCSFAACPGTTAPASNTATVQLNGIATVLDTEVLPTAIVSDSRCPVDAQCIQAGTVQVKATVGKGTQAAPFTLTLGTPVTIGDVVLTLSAVTPDNHTGTTIAPSDYRLTFTATSK